jgi:hypothetical protein
MPDVAVDAVLFGLIEDFVSSAGVKVSDPAGEALFGATCPGFDFSDAHQLYPPIISAARSAIA